MMQMCFKYSISSNSNFLDRTRWSGFQPKKAIAKIGQRENQNWRSCGAEESLNTFLCTVGIASLHLFRSLLSCACSNNNVTHILTRELFPECKRQWYPSSDCCSPCSHHSPHLDNFFASLFFLLFSNFVSLHLVQSNSAAFSLIPAPWVSFERLESCITFGHIHSHLFCSVSIWLAQQHSVYFPLISFLFSLIPSH